MPPDQPTWRPYDVPGDEPGERIQPDGVPLAKKKPSEQKKQPQQQPRKQQLPPDVAAGASVGLGVSGLVIALITTGIIVACGIGLFALVGSGAVGNPDMHSQEGVDELIEALEEDAGTTEIYGMTLYPDYAASVYAKVEGGDGLRYKPFYFDGGGLDDWGSPSTETEGSRTIDLRDIDASMFSDFCDEVAGMFDEGEDLSECYIIVEPPSVDDTDDSYFGVHVSTEFSESRYIYYDLDGDEVSRWEP